MISKIDKKIWQHLLALLIVIVYEQGLVLIYRGNISAIGFIFYMVNIPFFYLSSFYLFPNLNRRRLFHFLVWLIISYLIFFVLHFICYGTQQLSKGHKWPIAINRDVVIASTARFVYILGFSFAYYIARIGIQRAKVARQKELQLMEKERDQAELENAFLRSQINPHLLFNTLQFIQYQVEKGSDKAVRAVELLGEIMHYSLGATAKANTVPLEDELAYMEQYVELARLRNDKSQYFELKINTVEAAPNLQLPSGIIANFIENIFKHGDLSEKDHPAIAHILVSGREFLMHVANLKRNESIYRRTGIGMANVRKRLELLYPNRYSLREIDENNHYNLYFEIEL